MIRVESLTFTYPGGDELAVNDLSFTIDEGEIFGFLGPSGAGDLEVSRRQGEAPNRRSYPGASQQALEPLAQADSAISSSVSGGA